MAQSQNIQVAKPKVKKSEALWIMTFADLSFILMCFFALLLSMSTLNTKKYDNIIEGFTATKRLKKFRNLEAIRKQITREIKRKKLEGAVSVKLDADGLAIEFKNKLLFAPGSASLNPQYSRVTSSIIGIIAKSPPKYTISIEGHTDDTPLRGHRKYQSNWELSSARGISVLGALKKRKVDQKRMKVISYSDTNPKIDPKGKSGIELRNARAANRRVLIRLN